MIRFSLFLLLLLGALGIRSARAAEPAFAPNAKSVNKGATYLTDTVLYTVKLDNTMGTADALDVVFSDHLPRGIEVQLFALDGLPQVLTLLTDGLTVGTIPAGTSRTVTILGVVTGIPIRPDAAEYNNQASWTYRYRPAPNAAKVNASFATNSVSTRIVRLEPTIAIASVALNPLLGLGTEFTYTLRVENTGTLNSAGTTLTNLIPVGSLLRLGSTTLNGAPLPDGYFTLGNQINSPGEPPGQINAGETATISYKVTSLGLPDINLAVVDADGLGPIPPLNVRGAATAQSTDLSIVKSDGASSIAAGSEVTYTITVTNNGTFSLNSVRVVDALPLALSNPVWTASQGTYNPGSGDWTGLNLTSGASVSLTLKARVSPLATGVLVNTASVQPPAGVTDSNARNNSSTDSDTIALLSDLGVSQVDGLSSVGAGAPLSYVFTVSNTGPSALSNLTLTDALPSALQNPIFTPDEGQYNPATGAWTGLDLRAGQSVRLTLAGTVSPIATGTIVNTVSVAAPSGVLDLNAGNNSASDSNSVVAAPAQSLVLVQSVDKTLAKNGEILTYTITYRNSSADPLPGVGVRVATPAYTSFVSASYGALPLGLSGCTLSQPAAGESGAINWNFAGALAPNASGVVSFQVLVK